MCEISDLVAAEKEAATNSTGLDRVSSVALAGWSFMATDWLST